MKTNPILDALGGTPFLMKTGARVLMIDDTFLELGISSRNTNDAINRVAVSALPHGGYEMVFSRRWGRNSQEVARRFVSLESALDTFVSYTGLALAT